MSGYIKNICYYVIISTILFNIFPSEKYMKYIKLFSGFILVLIIISPITGILKKDGDISRFFSEYVDSMNECNLEENIEDYQEKIINRAMENYDGSNN